MLDTAKVDYIALGQAIDTTWGRSSTPRTSSYSVKFSLSGNILTAKYMAIVNFGTEREMIMMKRAYSEESIAHMSNVVSIVKSTYKEICGKSLRLTDMFSDETVEIIGFGVHNPKRTAYFRRVTQYEVG
jgi:hypothetical protein